MRPTGRQKTGQHRRVRGRARSAVGSVAALKRAVVVEVVGVVQPRRHIDARRIALPTEGNAAVVPLHDDSTIREGRRWSDIADHDRRRVVREATILVDDPPTYRPSRRTIRQQRRWNRT